MLASEEWRQFVVELLGGRSQMEIALKVGVSQTTISNWLKGKLPTDMSMVRNLAKATDQDPDELEEKVRQWTVSTSLQADYNLTDREAKQVQDVLSKILEERKKGREKI